MLSMQLIIVDFEFSVDKFVLEKKARQVLREKILSPNWKYFMEKIIKICDFIISKDILLINVSNYTSVIKYCYNG